MAMANYGQVSNKVYQEMTNYDIFMMKKQRKQAETRLFDRKQKQPEISYEQYRKRVEMPIRNELKTDMQYQKPQKEYSYKEYLLEQLQRNEPAEIMTEEEFYENNLKAKSFGGGQILSNDFDVQKPYKRYQKASNQAKNKDKKSRLVKGGKYFIAFYVLIVMAIASILIVMNTSTPFNSQSVDAAGASQVEKNNEVQPMNIDEKRESEESNWFDEMCKSLKK